MSYKKLMMAVACVTGVLTLLVGCPPNAMHQLTLVVQPAGTGEIIVSPQRSAYFAGTEVTLEAVPAENWVFQNWVASGLNTTANPTTMRVYNDNTITAVFRFTPDPPPPDDETTIVRDGSFELGPDSPHWTKLSGTGQPIICNATVCGTFDGLGAASGAHWAWFGNSPDFYFETATLNQRIYVPDHDEAQLSFNLAIPMAQVPFLFRVFLGDILLFEATEAAEGDYRRYEFENIDITGLVRDSNVTLRFLYSNTGVGMIGSQSAVFLDNVAIQVF